MARNMNNRNCTGRGCGCEGEHNWPGNFGEGEPGESLCHWMSGPGYCCDTGIPPESEPCGLLGGPLPCYCVPGKDDPITGFCTRGRTKRLTPDMSNIAMQKGGRSRRQGGGVSRVLPKPWRKR